LEPAVVDAVVSNFDPATPKSLTFRHPAGASAGREPARPTIRRANAAESGRP
jgi:hypothetical protein